MTDWRDFVANWEKQEQPKFEMHVCNCIGPQNGEPLCPCQMRHVQIINGRYVQVIDHGPAPKARQHDR